MQIIYPFTPIGNPEDTMPLLAGSNNESALSVHQLPPEPVIFGQTPSDAGCTSEA